MFTAVLTFASFKYFYEIIPDTNVILDPENNAILFKSVSQNDKNMYCYTIYDVNVDNNKAQWLISLLIYNGSDVNVVFITRYLYSDVLEKHRLYELELEKQRQYALAKSEHLISTFELIGGTLGVVIGIFIVLVCVVCIGIWCDYNNRKKISHVTTSVQEIRVIPEMSDRDTTNDIKNDTKNDIKNDTNDLVSIELIQTNDMSDTIKPDDILLVNKST
jgi:hypothetical protein